MKLLAIDVGNTHTVLGVYEDRRLVQHWRIQTQEGRTADDLLYEILLKSGFFSRLPHQSKG